MTPIMTKVTEKFPAGRYCIEDSVGYLLARSRTKLAKRVDAQLAAHDITSAQGAVVMMLASGNFSTAAELSRELYLDSASMTRMVDRLQKRGMLVRKPRGDDRRVIDLHLTETGTALAEQLPTLYSVVLNQSFADFSAEEVTTLKSLLRKLLDSNAGDLPVAEKASSKTGKKY